MPAKRTLRSRLPLIGGLLFMALFTTAVIWGVMHFIQGSDRPEPPKIQTISLVRPPPPKPPEEKPPEPQKIDKPKEEVKLDQPQPPQPEAPPPPSGMPDGPPNGMQTDLGPGDGFIPSNGPANNERRAWYSNMISRQLEEELRRAKALQGKDYKVVAQIWFNPAGAVSRVQLDKGTGDSALDEALRQEILQVSLRDPLPADIPQPVRLRVVSR